MLVINYNNHLIMLLYIPALNLMKGQRSSRASDLTADHVLVDKILLIKKKNLAKLEVSNVMSQVSEDAHRPRTELRDMAGEASKKQGCCTRCPGCCGGILIVTAVVSLAGAAVLGGLYPTLHKTVDRLIESVRTGWGASAVYCGIGVRSKPT